MTLTLQERLLSKIAINQESGCWNWTAYLNGAGYGVIGMPNHKSALAHRVAYEIHVGPIPKGLTIDHLCRNHACVNPAHLEPVTHAENMRRRFATQTHCRTGHEFTVENTRVRSYDSARICLTCEGERSHKKRAKEQGVSKPCGICPVCGKNIRIKRDGTLFFHGATRPIPGDRHSGGGFCRGMGKAPVEAVTS